MGYSKTYNHIRIEKDSLTTIWLSRPEKRNAINGLMASELIEAFSLLSDDDTVSVVLLRGEGGVFCAGGDLAWMASKTDHDHPPAVLGKLYQHMYFFTKPLIVLVHGHAMGGALGLVSCADFVVAEASARFSFSEVRLGLIPATISPYVIARMGQARAMQLMLSGNTIEAGIAREFGLADIVTEDHQAEAVCLKLGSDLLQNAPGAMKACKRLVREVSGSDVDEKLTALTVKALDEVIKSDEAVEGILAFREKRAPKWRKT